MLGSLTKGADLTSMIVSASLLKPYSSLQKLGTDMMSRSNYLPEIVACKDPLERSLMVAKFFISGFHPDTFDGKKPFNPILGEQCHHVFNHGEEFGKSYYFSEQVSHHPPIFAAHVVNDKIGVKATLTGKTKVIFGGNFIDVKFPGHKEIYFKEHDELYTIETPFLCVRGVMGIGKKGIERSGQLIVRCEKNWICNKGTLQASRLSRFVGYVERCRWPHQAGYEGEREEEEGIVENLRWVLDINHQCHGCKEWRERGVL
uniref:Oxysterol binding protein n=1 Tax=Palpitomonas bilix TaxID=652834 RepID=A0A7S3D665_9EUKA